MRSVNRLPSSEAAVKRPGFSPWRASAVLAAVGLSLAFAGTPERPVPDGTGEWKRGLVAGAVGSSNHPVWVDRDTRAGASVASDEPLAGIALLKPSGRSLTTGVVRFDPDGEEVELEVTLRGLPRGAYVLRAHALGDCSDPWAGSVGIPLTSNSRTDAVLAELVSHGDTAAFRAVSRLSTRDMMSLFGRAVVLVPMTGDAEHADARPVACGTVGYRG